LAVNSRVDPWSAGGLTDDGESVVERYRCDAYGGCTVLDADGSDDSDNASDVEHSASARRGETSREPAGRVPQGCNGEAGHNVVERYRYDAYGACTVLDADGSDDSDNASDVGNPFLFTGRRLDSEWGGMQYRNRSRRGGGRRRAEPEALSGARARSHAQRNRSYSTALGRFISRDPTGYLDGLSLYAYVAGQATLYGDPMGLGIWSGWIDVLELVPGLGTIINAIRTFILGRPGMDPGDYSVCAVSCARCVTSPLGEVKRCEDCVSRKQAGYKGALFALMFGHGIIDLAIMALFPPAQVALAIDALLDFGITVWAANRVDGAGERAKATYCICNPCAQVGG
jgi:RHS repeat-associated protein